MFLRGTSLVMVALRQHAPGGPTFFLQFFVKLRRTAAAASLYLSPVADIPKYFIFVQRRLSCLCSRHTLRNVLIQQVNIIL